GRIAVAEEIEGEANAGRFQQIRREPAGIHSSVCWFVGELDDSAQEPCLAEGVEDGTLIAACKVMGSKLLCNGLQVGAQRLWQDIDDLQDRAMHGIIAFILLLAQQPGSRIQSGALCVIEAKCW